MCVGVRLCVVGIGYVWLGYAICGGVRLCVVGIAIPLLTQHSAIYTTFSYLQNIQLTQHSSIYTTFSYLPNIKMFQ